MANQTPLVMVSGQVKRLPAGDTIPESVVGKQYVYSPAQLPGLGWAYGTTVANLTALNATPHGSYSFVRVTSGESGGVELYEDCGTYWRGPWPGWYANAPYALGANGEDVVYLSNTLDGLTRHTPSGAIFLALSQSEQDTIRCSWLITYLSISNASSKRFRVINGCTSSLALVLGIGASFSDAQGGYFNAMPVPANTEAAVSVLNSGAEYGEGSSVSPRTLAAWGLDPYSNGEDGQIPILRDMSLYKEIAWRNKDNVTFTVPGDVPNPFTGSARRYFSKVANYKMWTIGVSQAPSSNLTISILVNGTVERSFTLPAGQNSLMYTDPTDYTKNVGVQPGDYITINTSGATVKDLVVTME